MTEKIKLNSGETVLIDSEMKFLKERNWFWQAGYAMTHFRIEKGKYKIVPMHHCVIGKPLNGFVVDHINRNPLDNRRRNLRIVTRKGNILNRDPKLDEGLKLGISPKGPLTRSVRLHVTLTEDENEYIVRQAYEEGLSANAFLRCHVLKSGWRERLYNLKMNQPGKLSDIDPRRK